jgi:hypothetical protein
VAVRFFHSPFNPLNAQLNPICHLLALLGAHHILHVGRIRVNVIRPINSRVSSLTSTPSKSQWFEAYRKAVAFGNHVLK